MWQKLRRFYTKGIENAPFPSRQSKLVCGNLWGSTNLVVFSLHCGLSPSFATWTPHFLLLSSQRSAVRGSSEMTPAPWRQACRSCEACGVGIAGSKWLVGWFEFHPSRERGREREIYIYTLHMYIYTICSVYILHTCHEYIYTTYVYIYTTYISWIYIYILHIYMYTTYYYTQINIYIYTLHTHIYNLFI